MAIYIEVVILDNFIIDFLILQLCGKFCGRRLAWWRGCFSSLVGVVVAILSVMNMGEFCILAIKLFGSALMVLVAFGLRQFFKMLGSFYCFTFLLGGIAMGVLHLKEGAEFGALGKMSELPTGILFLAVAIGYQTAKKIIYILGKRQAVFASSRFVSVENNGKKVSLKGFLDTGNLLQYCGEGVCICEYRHLLPILNAKNQCGTIHISTANGEGEMSLYRVDKITIFPPKGWKNGTEESYEKVPIALSKIAISSDFEIILSAILMSQGE